MTIRLVYLGFMVCWLMVACVKAPGQGPSASSAVVATAPPAASLVMLPPAATSAATAVPATTMVLSDTGGITDAAPLASLPEIPPSWGMVSLGDQFLLWNSPGGTLQLWQWDALQATPTLRRTVPFTDPFAISADGTLLAYGANQSITVLDLVSGELLTTLTGFEGNVIYDLAFSADGSRLLASTVIQVATAEGPVDRGRIHLWEIASGTHLDSRQLPEPVSLPDHFPTTGVLITISDLLRPCVQGLGQSLVRAWRWEEWLSSVETIQPLWEQAVDAGTDVELRRDEAGQLLVMGRPRGDACSASNPRMEWEAASSLPGFWSNQLALWEAASGQPVLSLQYQSTAVEHLTGWSLHPSGTSMAVSLNNERLEVWDVETDQRLASHTLPVYQMSYSPDGRFLVLMMGQEEATIEIREATTLRLLRTLKTGFSRPQSLIFILDGQILIAKGDELIQFWAMEE